MFGGVTYNDGNWINRQDGFIINLREPSCSLAITESGKEIFGRQATHTLQNSSTLAIVNDKSFNVHLLNYLNQGLKLSYVESFGRY